MGQLFTTIIPVVKVSRRVRQCVVRIVGDSLRYFWRSPIGRWLAALDFGIIAYRTFAIFLGLFLIAILHVGWLKLPLTEGWQGSNITLGATNIPIAWFVFGCYIIGLVTAFCGQKVGLFVLMLPPTLLFCWPIVSVVEPAGVFPLYFEEARNRAIIERVFRLQNQLNINIQPTYTPIFDTQSLWSQIKSIFASLSIGWYLFCVFGLALPALAYRACKKQRGLFLSYACLPFALIVLFYQLPQKNHYQFPTNSAGEYAFIETLERCRRSLVENADLAHSDFFVTRCAEAYNTLHGWSGPIAKLPLVSKLMGDRSFLSINARHYAELAVSLYPMLSVEVDDPLLGAFYTFAKRHYALLRQMQALNALQEGNYHEASSYINYLAKSERGPAAWVVHGYAASQLGHTDEAMASFNRATLMLTDKTVIANIYCSIGDSLVKAGRLAQARGYYQSCKEQDPERNYWAVSGLGGI